MAVRLIVALALFFFLTEAAYGASIPPLPADRLPKAEKLNTGCFDKQILKAVSGGKLSCSVDKGATAGSPVVVDLGDDGVDESNDMGEFAVTNDPDSVVTEASDKVTVDLGKLISKVEMDTEGELETLIGDTTDVFTNNDTLPKANLPSAVAYGDEANAFTQLNEFKDVELDDQDATPVADRRLRVTGGEIRATDTSNTEGQYISAASIEQGTGSTLDADKVDGNEASVFSGTGSCSTNEFVTNVNSLAAPTCAQPSFSNLSGTATDTQLPSTVPYEDEANAFTQLNEFKDVELDDQAPTIVADRRLRVTGGKIRAADTSNTEGQYISAGSIEQGTGSTLDADKVDGNEASVFSGTGACGSNQFVTSINSLTTPTCTQPGFSDLSGIATDTQLPSTVPHEDEANAFTQLNEFKDVELDDQAATPTADRRLRVTDGFIRATTTANVEGQYISASSIEQGTGSGLDADKVDGNEASALSGTGSCASDKFVTSVNSLAAPTCTQPGFTNLSGTASDTQLGVYTGSATWDPADLADEAHEATTVTVTGADTNDQCVASLPSIGTNDMLLSCHIQADDTARVILKNVHGSNVNLSSDTVYVRVWSN